MAGSSQIGAIHVEASLNSGKFVEGAKKLEAAAKRTETGVKKSFGGMETAVGRSMGALKAGAAGFVAALSVGMFTQVIGNALKYASSLKTVSDQLGVTTKDLQTLRYAAQQSGVSQQELDNGLERLSVTLGKVAAGAREPTRAIEAIGLSAEKLKGKNTAEALKLIADRLSEIPDQAQRAAVETALFGEAGAKLDGLLRKGSAGINELAQAAEELGVVLSEEDIRKADETAKKLESLKTVLQARIAGVVAENADAILTLANALATVADFAAKAIGLLGRVGSAIASLPQPPAWVFTVASLTNPALAATLGAKPGSSQTVTLPPARKSGGGGSRNISQFLAPSPRTTRPKRAPKDTSLRDAFQFESEMRRAEMDVLRATQSLSTDYIRRSEIAIQLLDLERKQYAAELEFRVKDGDLKKAQADQLQLEYDKKDALERQALLADRKAQRFEESARLDDLTLSLERDRLESEAQLAETASEERAIRLRLLDLAYRQERARLETILADEQASFAAKEEARRRLANLNSTQANDEQAVINGTRGPWEQFMADLSPAQLEAQWQSLQVNGIMGAVDALAQFDGTLDSVLSNGLNLVRQFISEWLRLQLLKGLAGVVGAGSGQIFGGAQFSFAGGGGFDIKGRPGIDKNVMSINGLPVANVSYGERVQVSNDNSSGGRGGMTIHAPITINGNASRETIAQIESSMRRAVGNATRKGTA